MALALQQPQKAGKPAVRLSIAALVFFMMAGPGSGMDVLVAHQMAALNGSTVRIQCTFTSCYKMESKHFAMNWTYQETTNHSEVMFMTFSHKRGMLPLRPERFSDRVVFSGNLDKNDVSVTLAAVQPDDEGVYNCYVRNPPDRIQGHGAILLRVVTELPPPRDSTIAVAIGASVGGALALLILSMVVLKCLRHRRQQGAPADEHKMEEEGKMDPEAAAADGNKQ